MNVDNPRQSIEKRWDYEDIYKREVCPATDAGFGHE